jgi:hypothetical protein
MVTEGHCQRFFGWAVSFGDHYGSTLANRICGRDLPSTFARLRRDKRHGTWEPGTGDGALHAGIPGHEPTSAKALLEFELLDRLLWETEVENDRKRRVSQL